MGNSESNSYIAIVTDGTWRKSLSAIRSLGKNGFTVFVMGDSLLTTGFWSRYTSKRIIAPTCAKNPYRFGKELLKLLIKCNKNYHYKPILFPMEDTTLKWVIENLDSVLQYAYTLVPTQESYNICVDKGLTMRMAKELSLPYPKTWEPDSVNELIEIIKSMKPKEFIIKPRSGTGSFGIVYENVFSFKEWKRHWNKYGPLLIQERIPQKGKGIGVAILIDNKGKCVANFTYERLQEYPVTGGPSTVRQSISDTLLVKKSLVLLRKLSWKGIAMVEWKNDIRDGIPKLMEINPRFWGSLELSIRAGVDFPLLFAKASMGVRLEELPKYKLGVKCRWMIPGEILRYINQPKSKRESLTNFLKDAFRSAEEWDKRDIKGFLATIICQILLAINPKYWKYLRRKNNH